MTNGEFHTPERCWVTELANHASDPAVSVARIRVEPDVTTCWRLSP